MRSRSENVGGSVDPWTALFYVTGLTARLYVYREGCERFCSDNQQNIRNSLSENNAANYQMVASSVFRLLGVQARRSSIRVTCRWLLMCETTRLSACRWICHALYLFLYSSPYVPYSTFAEIRLLLIFVHPLFEWRRIECQLPIPRTHRHAWYQIKKNIKNWDNNGIDISHGEVAVSMNWGTTVSAEIFYLKKIVEIINGHPMIACKIPLFIIDSSGIIGQYSN